MKLKINRVFRVLVFICVLVILTTVTYTTVTIRATRVGNRSASITYYSDVRLPIKSVKKILIWTTFFGRPYDLDDARRCLSQCDVNCSVTDDKREADDSDAIEFHLSDLWSIKWRIGTRSMVEVPVKRAPQQVWILYNLEPPIHMWGDLSIFNGLFNWTKWYRLDSDIPSPYGVRQKLSTAEQVKAEKSLKSRNFFKEKRKDFYLRISNCYDIGKRYTLIDQLGKQFNIDKFGQCYPGGRCDEQSCGEHTLKQYKFHLAFENDHCKDYLSEKYWRALHREQIPVVNWKHGAFPSAIPNSYINIFDFKTMDEATKYIRSVKDNETLYNSFFRYKVRYKEEAKTCSMCAVCRALHNTSRQGQVYSNLESWIRDDTCHKIQIWTEIVRNVNGFLYYWFGLYW